MITTDADSRQGSYTYKFQYAAAAFDWTSETVSEFLVLRFTS